MQNSPSQSLYRSVRIGNLHLDGNLFLAPIAGYSDRAFRAVCRAGGANFTYTEMVSSEALVRSSDKTDMLLRRSPAETEYAVQLFGGNAEIMAHAAKIVVERVHPSLIDINAGCPVHKIVKTGAGAALIRDPERLFAITQAVVNAVSPLPVSVKIRSGWDSASLLWKDAVSAVLSAGVNAITLHPRTRAQGYEGRADWSALTELVHSAPSIPVFGSGDVFSPEDARRMLEETGCAGVMFARGALGNPFVFQETRALLETGEYQPVVAETRIIAGLHEMELLVSDIGEYSACREMRKRFCAYSKGLTDGAELRRKIVAAETMADYRKIFQEELKIKQGALTVFE